MTKPILEVQNLSKRFGGICAASNFSFDLRESEILGLVGPNGAGKTTVFNIITGVYRPDSGKIIFKGQNIVGLSPHKIVRMGIVKAHQFPRPFTSLTVLENLLVVSTSCLNMQYGDAKTYCLKILELVGLSSVDGKYPSSLLPVEVKKLELARALACKPKVLLLDEPAAGMRGKDIKNLLEVIKEIQKMGTVMVIVEHRIGFIVKAVERLIVMHRGQKIAEGAPEEVISLEVVKEAYLG